MTTFNEKGSSLLGAVAAITLLSAMGLGMTDLSINSQETQSQEQMYDEAFGVTQAGLEYALRKVYVGESPIVTEPGLTFGRGNFVASKSGRTITVEGRVGDSRVEHQLLIPTQAECFGINVEGGSLVNGGTRITGIDMSKLCLGEVVITHIRINWEPLEGTNDDDDNGIECSHNKTEVCHIPPGNPDNAHEICISSNAVNAHINHGDSLGACDGTGAIGVPTHLTKIRLDDVTLYTDSFGVPPNTLINTSDVNITDNSTHTFTKIDFNTPILNPIHFTMELFMEDQSLVYVERDFDPANMDYAYAPCDEDDTSNGYVPVCHVIPGSPPQEQTICVLPVAVDLLVEHGDTAGACN